MVYPINPVKESHVSVQSESNEGFDFVDERLLRMGCARDL